MKLNTITNNLTPQLPSNAMFSNFREYVAVGKGDTKAKLPVYNGTSDQDYLDWETNWQAWLHEVDLDAIETAEAKAKAKARKRRHREARKRKAYRLEQRRIKLAKEVRSPQGSATSAFSEINVLPEQHSFSDSDSDSSQNDLVQIQNTEYVQKQLEARKVKALRKGLKDIPSSIVLGLTGELTTKRIFNTLREHAYPTSMSSTYLERLQKAHLKPNESPSDLAIRIKRMYHRTLACHSLVFNDMDPLLRVYFCNALPQEMKVDLDPSVDNLATLIGKAHKSYQTTRSIKKIFYKCNQEGENRPHKNKNTSSHGHSKRPKLEKTDTWCSFHKVKTHSTSDCRAKPLANSHSQGRRNFNSQNKDSSENKNNRSSSSKTASVNQITEILEDQSSISSPYDVQLINVQENPSKIMLTFIFNNKEVIGQIDTGAQVSVISASTAKRLEIPLLPLAHPTSIRVANGKVTTATHKLNTLCKIPALGNAVSLPVTCIVLPELSTELLLGMDFLSRSHAKIDFQTQSISLLGKTPINFGAKLQTSKAFSAADHESIPDQYLYERLSAFDTLSISQTDQTHMDIVKALLDKYPSILGSDSNIGCLKDVQFRIDIKENAILPKARPYPVAHKYEQQYREALTKLEQLGIIEKCRTTSTCAGFPVPKPNGEARPVVDYQPINKITIHSHYPLPRAADIFPRLGKSKWFSQLDFNSGYHQIEIHPDDMDKTGFIVPWGNYRYRRVPFGLSGAPGFFQFQISKIFQDLSNVEVFLDDILVHSKDENDHTQHLEEVFSRLATANLTLNMKKSHFFQKEVTYLGFRISEKGITPAQRNIDTLKQFQTPKTRRAVRRIVGAFNFFRSLVPNFSTRMAEITNLTANSTPFKWKTEYTQTLNSIVNDLENSALNYHPDFNKPFQIFVDASNIAVGGILMQEGHLISCFSQKLNSAQRNYTTTEKEALAIVLFLLEKRSMLLGCKLHIYTDHSNLLYTSKSPLQRVQRWSLIIDEFNPTVHYIQGKNNTVADYLSRPDINSLDPEDYPLHPSVIAQAQANCEETQAIIQNISRSNLATSKYVLTRPSGYAETVLALRNKNTPYIPVNLRELILNWTHCSFQHPGISKLYHTLIDDVYWPKMHQDIVSFTNSCLICGRNKNINKQYGELQGHLTSQIPFTHVAVDVYGPIEFRHLEDDDMESSPDREYTCILSIIDMCTRWVELIPLPNTTGAAVAKAFDDNWLCRYPKPLAVTSDNGTNFIGGEFTELLRSYGIKHITTTSYNPQGNSIVERIHGFIGNSLRCTQSRNWRDQIPAIAWSLRSTYHRILKCSPADLVFGCKMLNPAKRFATTPLLTAANNSKRSLTQSNLAKQNESRIIFSFQTNKYAYIKNPNPRKMEPRYSGPYRIVDVRPANNIAQLDLGNSLEWINFRRLKPLLEEVNIV